MIKQQDVHVFTGMQRDVSVSKLKAEFLYDGLNVRLTAREGDNMYSLTNELGTKKILEFKGKYLGHCVLGNFLVIFAKDMTLGTDFIYRVEKYGSLFLMTTLYLGNLNFQISNPIETLGAYENENILKVYWTDGVNQPRVINIVKDRLNPNIIYNDNSFDFILDLQLNEKVEVIKEANSSGLFGAGCIQYAITYFNKYGQESNIAYTTPIYYTNFSDRAASPEDRVGIAFRVKVYNVDTNFEYIRLYSIFRSSLDAVPTVKRVIDIELGGSSGGTKRFLGVIESDDNWHEVTLGNIFISENGKNDWKAIGWYENYKESFSPQGVTSTYWKFTKEEFPYLIIRYTSENGVDKYITWGDATELYIPEGNISGGSGPDNVRKILSTDGRFNVCTKAFYSDPLSDIGIVDDGSTGDIVDPSSLLYVGGETVTATTLTSKDGTLFLGNLSIVRPSIPEEIKDLAKSLEIKCDTRKVFLPRTMHGKYYKWENTLNAYGDRDEKICTNMAGFKWREHYRLGIQFLYRSGKWSEPVFVDDAIQSEKPSNSYDYKGEFINVPKFSIELSSEICKNLKNLGYKKARAMAVFPSLQDRLVLTQGLLCPTVFSVASRKQGNIYALSSWFTRPFPSSDNSIFRNEWPDDVNGDLKKYAYDIVTANNVHNANLGSYNLYHHLYSLLGHRDRGAEIQGVPPVLCGVPTDKIVTEVGTSNGITIRESSNSISNGETIKDSAALGNIFGVDLSILTYHSPDIQFDDGISVIDLTDFKFRRVGYVRFGGSQGDIDIQTKTPTAGLSSGGFFHRSTTSQNGRGLSSGLFYSDYLVDDNGSKYEAYPSLNYDFLFMVYPWNKSGSLNNDIVRDGRTALLQKKKISNIRWTTTNYFDYNKEDIANFLLGSLLGYGGIAIAPPQLFSSSETLLIKINDSGASYNYYGNVDSVLVPPARYGSIFSVGEANGEVIAKLTNETGNVSFTDDASNFAFLQKYGVYFGEEWTTSDDTTIIGDKNSALRYNKDLIRLKYKSTPHMVIKLTNMNMESIDVESIKSVDRLYLAELYRDEKPNSDFGGKSDFALKENLWIPAGDPVTLSDDNVNVDFIYGDTWYQRYDCLKTYPFTLEDENSVVDIVSFVCETRVNMDGRYDRNRGNTSNLYMSPINFNLLNPIYSLKNNFFNYRILDKDYYNLNNFPSTITWSTLKFSAAEVDAWTTVTMASTLDLDGDKGAVTSLKVSQDSIYCFQERGISQVLFNSRVLIPASDGVPIEISNSYKVDGSRYISENIGCINKWSICHSPSGLYFIDSIGKTLMLLNGNLLSSISDTHGFGQWFDTLDTLEWGWQSPYATEYISTIVQPINGDSTAALSSPILIDLYSWKGVKVFYDFNNNDLYTVTNSSALCLSELLSQFVSFYSYEQSLAMFNIGSDFFSIHDNSVWKLFSGSHNNFFGSIKPSHFTFVSNQNNGLDKIFSNLELRADFYSNSNKLKTYNFFNSILVWNEYQDTGVVNLSPRERNGASHPYNVKRKFRIWGVDIPRDKTHRRDRIRNPWTKIKLSFTPSNEVERFELHDVGVIYYT